MKRIFSLISLLVIILGITVLSLDSGDRIPETSGPIYARKPAVNGPPTYVFAVHPLHNPTKLSQAYQPLIDYLNQHLDAARLELEASRDYQAYETKLAARTAEFLLPNPWQTLEAMKVGYRVLAMAGDAGDFRGIFIARKDGAIRNPSDLKGKTVSYPSPTAIAACVLPQYFLHAHGIDVNRDIENYYVGSQESSIMNVYLRQSAVAATWPPPWRLFQKDHPAEAAELAVLWETPPLVNNSVMMRDDVPEALGQKLRELLAHLHDTPQGRAILAGMQTARFHPANDASYEPVRRFVADFERQVRPIAPR